MRDHVKLQTAILLRRLAYVLGHAAKSGNEGAIRDLPVAIGRFSNCLRVFAQFYPRHEAKRIRHRLDRLMEMAGGLRDLDVTLDLLGRGGMPPRAALAARLREERRKSSNRLLREIRLWKNRDFSRKWRSRLDL
jgi:CHAD domain-containing protein